jgi:hypothetical protein
MILCTDRVFLCQTREFNDPAAVQLLLSLLSSSFPVNTKNGYTLPGYGEAAFKAARYF